MRSTFSGLEIGKRALFAQNAALNITGHNIANAGTPGYSRQVADMQATRPMAMPGMMKSNAPGQVGTGVEVSGYRRIRESFLDDQFRNENKSLGEWSIRSDTLEKLEAIMNEPSDTGFATVLDSFWNAWHDLSRPDNPDNLTARAVLKERAVALAETFNQTASKLNDLKNDLTRNIEIKVSEVNNLLDKVASLNNEIFRIEALGDQANDLRDQRDLLVDQISKIINVSVSQQPNGYRLTMGSVELVNGAQITQPLDAGTVAGQAAGGDLSGGEIYGMIISRDTYVNNYIDQLDALAKTLATGEVQVTLPAGSVVPEGTVLPKGTVLQDGTVLAQDTAVTGPIESRTLASETKVTVKGLNGLQHLGYSLQDPPQPGLDFFTVKPGASGLSASTIQVNPEIVNNVANIAASTATYVGEDGNEHVLKGNGDLASIIAGLRDVSFNFDPDNTGKPILTGGTFNEFINAYIGQLGVQGQEAKRQVENQTLLVNQVDARRQSVSGVSTDEEMANMIKFQQAYNAAARMITTVDEMLDKVINGMGIVGR